MFNSKNGFAADVRNGQVVLFDQMYVVSPVFFLLLFRNLKRRNYNATDTGKTNNN